VEEIMSESMHVEEGTIHAWLDGALPPDESRRVEGHVGSCAVCAAAVAEARGLIAASSRILSVLDEVPGGVLPGREERDQLAAIRQRHRVRSPWWRQRQVLAAASLLLVAGTSAVVWRRSQPDTRFPSSAIPSAPAASEVTEARADQATAPPDEAKAEASRAPEAADRLPATPPPAPVPGVERRVQSESLARRRALSDAVSRLEVAAQPRTRAARDVAAPGRDMDSASLAKTVPTFPLQQQAGAGQAFEAARQGALARSAVPAAANALGLGRNATGATSAASLREELSVPSGCWELRGPDPVGGRLLGVPDSVRLRPDTVATDATWHAAESLDSAAVQTVLKWQLKDPLTVELRVLRPLDSTVVRFRTSVTADQLQRTEMPAGILAAAATRIVCP
jgi:hypothetical protein